MSHGTKLKKSLPVLIAALMVMSAVCRLCGQSEAAPLESPPDFHPIAYDAAVDTLEDAHGAAACVFPGWITSAGTPVS